MRMRTAQISILASIVGAVFVGLASTSVALSQETTLPPAMAFDCSKPTSWPEEVACSNEDLIDQIASALARHYSQLFAVLTKSEREELKKEQDQWTAKVTATCKKLKRASYKDWEKYKKSADYCVGEFYSDREAVLGTGRLIQLYSEDDQLCHSIGNLYNDYIQNPMTEFTVLGFSPKTGYFSYWDIDFEKIGLKRPRGLSHPYPGGGGASLSAKASAK